MKKIDFLSSAPNLFIFKNKTNKTNLGGFFFLSYLIIMFFISCAYILDYILYDKYETQFFQENLSNQRRTDDYINDERFKSEMDFHLEFHGIDLNLSLYDSGNKKFLGKKNNDFYYKSLDSEFLLEILQICENDTFCPNNINNYKEYAGVLIKYKGYDINLSSYGFKELDDKSFTYDFKINYNEKPFSLYTNWEYIIFKEIKGISRLFSLLRNKKDYNIGKFLKNDYVSDTLNWSNKITNRDGVFVKTLGFIGVYHDNPGRTYITRKKISVLDVLAKIGSLFVTINSFFAFCFKYYSQNYDKYKIIEMIFNSKKNAKIELSTSNNDNNVSQKKIQDNKDIDDINIKEVKNIPLIKDYSFDDNNDDNEGDLNNNGEEKKNLPQLIFINYIYNCIYTEKYCQNKNQKIINIINEIIVKYLSIESIFFNQLKLENLFKDYIWNDSSLNNIENNDLIKKLKLNL